jgi:hypothetical protein
MSEFFNKRKNINELRRLSDHHLNDIGITRGDIFELTRPDYSGFFKKFRKSPYDEYLSQSSDLADVERKQRNLHRKGLI